MKISLITVVYNGKQYLRECFKSVFAQTYQDIEYLVIDGASTDGTIDIIKAYEDQIDYFISEPDQGLYDAINKGIAKATGDIVGIINADDMFASADVLEKVAHHFSTHPSAEALYGDLNYIHPISGKIVRIWKSKHAHHKDLCAGWMPAHPTLYVKKELFKRYGHYTSDLGTAADYDLILRFFYKYNINAVYLPELMINMRTGGLSNRSFLNMAKAFLNDYRAMKRNGLPNAYLALIKKKWSKISQF